MHPLAISWVQRNATLDHFRAGNKAMSSVFDASFVRGVGGEIPRGTETVNESRGGRVI